MPTSESTLLLFVAHLASQKLSHSTIKVYLSGGRSLHMAQGCYESFNKCLTPQHQQVIKGIHKDNAIASSPRIYCAITIQIMKGIKQVLLKNQHDYNNINYDLGSLLSGLLQFPSKQRFHHSYANRVQPGDSPGTERSGSRQQT